MATARHNELDADLRNLDKSIGGAHFLVLAWMVAWVLIYACRFAGWPPSDDPSKWGVFGDFFGGVLNPIVAYAAFTWLTKSVRLQKEELAETRRALSDSADAQKEQVRLSALTALTNSIMTEVEIQRHHLTYLATQISSNPAGNVRDLEGRHRTLNEAQKLMDDINKVISTKLSERLRLENEIRQVLHSLSGSQEVTE